MSQAGKVEAHSFRREFILQGLSSEPPPSDPEKEKELLEAKKASKEAGDKLVQRFIDKNKELWQRFINHGFLQQLATEAKAAKPQASVPEDPTPANSSFKEYLKVQTLDRNRIINNKWTQQDYYYLLNLVRFRAGRLTKFRGDASLWNLKSEIAKIDSAYKFAVTFRQQCLGKVLIPDTDEYRDEKLLNDLKIDEKDLSDPNGPGVAVLGYNSFLQDRVALEEWVTLYIATIPCIYVSFRCGIVLRCI